MFGHITALILGLLGVFASLQLWNLRRNLAIGKSSGFKCIILPVYMFSVPSWVITRPFLLPLMRRLPESWTGAWLPLLGIENIWHHGYEPFETIGEDTFMAVSPMGNILFTNDPQASSQLLAGRTFEKPARKIMPMLNIYGPTITGTDGDEARLYRKIAAPFFKRSTMQRVWDESIICVKEMMQYLARNQQSEEDLREAIGVFNLHVISAVGFGSEIGALDMSPSAKAPDGHSMTFSQAMLTFINCFMTIFLVPMPVLKISPFSAHRHALESFEELQMYMEELRDSKTAEQKGGVRDSANSEPNLLDLIVQASDSKEKELQVILSPDAVMGNIFILLFAGHEANVNTLQFAIILLACYPSFQKTMQADIDRISDESTPLNEEDSFSYDRHFALLMDSMVGAVMNETLRLYSVVPVLTKTTLDNPQTIQINNQSHVIPPNTVILINKSATHRNPKFWDSRPRKSSVGKPSALGDFNPEQWILQDKDGNQKLLNPVRGSFLAFGEGSRGCLGKDFGQAELCAFLAQLFKNYSVELAVEDLKLDDTDAMKRQKWQASRDHAEREMSSNVEFHMSLRLAGKVPVRFVKRGQETFAPLIV